MVLIDDVEGFDWLDWVVEKIIGKHGVDPDEVEECFANQPQKVRRVQEGKYQTGHGQSRACGFPPEIGGALPLHMGEKTDA